MPFGKMEIVNCLSAVNGFRSFLEIATATTGREISRLDRRLFDQPDRLIYNIPDTFDDGAPIDFRSSTLAIDLCTQAIDHTAKTYEVIFVDPYHDYECSRRDIELALRLLRPGGAVVIHDCLPPSGGDLISPTFVPGAWCGVTFIAYVDAILSGNLSFQTVDCDYGCGIIYNIRRQQSLSLDLKVGWDRVKSDPERARQYMIDNKGTLLNFVSVDQFTSSLLDEIQTTARRLRLVETSRSWRLTAPLRAARWRLMSQ
jgi:hypothetical protein